MSATNTPLPDFEGPPVVEVALAIQFKRLERLRAAHLGLLWSKFRDRGFPRTEDHGPLEPASERFDRNAVQPQLGIDVRVFDVPPLPRVWFLNEGGTQLIQFQPDRFVERQPVDLVVAAALAKAFSRPRGVAPLALGRQL